MAGNTQMNENERGVMSLNGLTGGIIATVLLLTVLITVPLMIIYMVVVGAIILWEEKDGIRNKVSTSSR